MRILVSGSSGLIGSALVASLDGAGHESVRLVRSAEPVDATGHAGRPASVLWNPNAARLEPGPFEGFDAVVHLAGENIFGLRWTKAKKAQIFDSRVLGTRLLCETLARLDQPPRVLVSASGVNYYGNSGDQERREDSPPGEGFLAEVCKAWENATRPAADAGIRVVNMRLGVVLSPRGGALRTMLRPFRLGLGGRLGSGRQYVSWITLDDVVRAAEHLIVTDSLAGPVNAVSPCPATNRELTRALGSVLHRPVLLPAPAIALRVLLGEMADELLLSSVRVLPHRLVESGFRHEDPELEPALRRILS